MNYSGIKVFTKRGTSLNTLDMDKLEVQKQWDKDPCGACTVKDFMSGTLDYYRAARNHRYTEYGIWFEDVMKFQDYSDKDILEIGVGLGSDHFRFASNGNRMTALDLSKEHLKHTSQHLELEGLSTKPIYGDAEAMPFEDASFDVVYSFGVLHHTPNTQVALSEVYRVLRPGGQAIIGLYHRNSVFFWLMTVMVSGIIKLGFFRKGFRRTMYEIEYRADSGSAVPLVKTYTRREVKKMFCTYSKVDVDSCHVEPSHFWRLGPILSSCFSKASLERWLGFFGWYLVIKAKK